MYTITITWTERSGHKQAVYALVKAYEITGGVLTLAFDANHDTVVPLWEVVTVDIVRQE